MLVLYFTAIGYSFCHAFPQTLPDDAGGLRYLVFPGFRVSGFFFRNAHALAWCNERSFSTSVRDIRRLRFLRDRYAVLAGGSARRATFVQTIS